MGGDLEKIQTVGKYMVEVWKSAGMNLDNVEFVQSSDIINEKSNEYWTLVLDIATKFNRRRIERCSQIMGRSDTDSLAASQIFYPCMQCADIFFLKADICQLGMDQRKVNVLAREYCDLKKRKFKPIILSHHMLLGLKALKMSKSDPSSAIFMDDSAQEVEEKIMGAVCPHGEITVLLRANPSQAGVRIITTVENNPCLEYMRYIVLPVRQQVEINGVVYDDIDTLTEDFVNGKFQPIHLKKSLIAELNVILQPVRDHFASGESAELLRQVRSFQITK
jgi:tyrosyl-tRNA synthetase